MLGNTILSNNKLNKLKSNLKICIFSLKLLGIMSMRQLSSKF